MATRKIIDGHRGRNKTRQRGGSKPKGLSKGPSKSKRVSKLPNPLSKPSSKPVIEVVNGAVFSKAAEKWAAEYIHRVSAAKYNTYKSTQPHDILLGDSCEYCDFAISFKKTEKDNVMMADFKIHMDEIINGEQIILVIQKFKKNGNNRIFEHITEIDITGSAEIFYGTNYPNVQRMYDDMRKIWSGYDISVRNRSSKEHAHVKKMVNDIQAEIRKGGGIMKLQWKCCTGNNRFQGALSENALLKILEERGHGWAILMNKSKEYNKIVFPNYVISSSNV